MRKKRRLRPKPKKIPKIKKRQIKRKIIKPVNNHKFLSFFKKAIPILFFILIIILLIKLIINSDLFSIKNIKCNFGENDCSRENIKINQSFYEYNFFNLNETKIEPYFYNTYPQIKSVKFKKNLKGDLEINLIPEIPIAQIKNQNNEYFFINQNGKVFKKAYNSKLTTIISDYSPIVGESFANSALIASLDIVKLTKDSYIPVLELEIKSLENIVLNLNLETVAYLNGNKNIEKQIDSLQFILKNGKLEDQKIKVIDLRFDNPVVK